MKKGETASTPRRICSIKLNPIASWKWGFWIVFIFVINILVFSSIFLLYWRISSENGPALGFVYTFRLLLICLLILFISLLITYINWKKSQQTISFYYEGISIKKSKPRNISWSSIDQYDAIRIDHCFFWICIKKSWLFIFKLKNGKTMKVRVHSDIPEKFITEIRLAYQLSHQAETV